MKARLYNALVRGSWIASYIVLAKRFSWDHCIICWSFLHFESIFRVLQLLLNGRQKQYAKRFFFFFFFWRVILWKFWPEVLSMVPVWASQRWIGETGWASSPERTHVQWTRMVWSPRWRTQTSGNDSRCHREWQLSLWPAPLKLLQLTPNPDPDRIQPDQDYARDGERETTGK